MVIHHWLHFPDWTTMSLLLPERNRSLSRKWGHWSTCSTQLALATHCNGSMYKQIEFDLGHACDMGLNCHKSVYTVKQIKLDTPHHHQCTHLTMFHREAIYSWQPVWHETWNSQSLKVPFAHFKRYTRLYICHLHHQVLELRRQWNVCLDALDHQCPNNTLTFPDSKQWVAQWLCRCLHSDDRRHRKGVPTVTVASLSIWRFDIWT